MESSAFDPADDLNALRGLLDEHAAAADDIQATWEQELSELEAVCQSFSESRRSAVQDANRERDELRKAAADADDRRCEAERRVADLKEQLDRTKASCEKAEEDASTTQRLDLQLELEQLRVQLKSAQKRLAEEKRRASEDRDGWESDLDKLREALDVRDLAEAACHGAQDERASRAAASPPFVTDDPVLGAVLAEFQRLGAASD